MLQLRFFILTLMLILSCTAQKEGSQTTTRSCNQEVLVIDKSGMDGCGLLLQLPNGDKWLVVENDTDQSFQAGERWKIGYEKVDDYMSSCMMEQAAVKIVCQEKMPAACEDQRDVFKISWLRKKMGDWQPLRVYRYQYQSEVVYLVERAQGNFLFSCRGEQWCAGKGAEWTACLANYKANFGKEAIIYQGEGQID